MRLYACFHVCMNVCVSTYIPYGYTNTMMRETVFIKTTPNIQESKCFYTYMYRWRDICISNLTYVCLYVCSYACRLCMNVCTYSHIKHMVVQMNLQLHAHSFCFNHKASGQPMLHATLSISEVGDRFSCTSLSRKSLYRVYPI